MRTPRLPLLAIIGLVIAALLLVGCGEEAKRPPPPRKGPAAAPKLPDPVLAEFDLLGENPKWVPIKAMFAAYQHGSIDGLANPLQTNLVTFIQKPIIERKPRAEGDGRVELPTAAKDGDEKVDETDPRREFPLSEYKLIVLLTGTARPKAVMVSPRDERFELSRGDPIGKEGGRIRAVTQFSLLIAMPGKLIPLEISLRPPLTKLDLELAPKNKVSKKTDF